VLIACTDYLCAPPVKTPKPKSAKIGTLDFLRPDAKSQVTFRYDENGKAFARLMRLFCQRSTAKSIKQADPFGRVMEEIIKPFFLPEGYQKTPNICIKPNGQFIIGGQWAIVV